MTCLENDTSRVSHLGYSELSGALLGRSLKALDWTPPALRAHACAHSFIYLVYSSLAFISCACLFGRHSLAGFLADCLRVRRASF